MTAELLKDFIPNKSAEWLKVAESFRISIPEKVLSNEEYLKIIENCDNEITLTIIFRYFYQEIKTNPLNKDFVHNFFKTIDNSNFCTKEWIEALVEFDHYLNKNNRKSSLKTMIGYLSCAEESPDFKNTKLELKILLNRMLDQFGFVG